MSIYTYTYLLLTYTFYYSRTPVLPRVAVILLSEGIMIAFVFSLALFSNCLQWSPIIFVIIKCCNSGFSLLGEWNMEMNSETLLAFRETTGQADICAVQDCPTWVTSEGDCETWRVIWEHFQIFTPPAWIPGSLALPGHCSGPKPPVTPPECTGFEQ